MRLTLRGWLPAVFLLAVAGAAPAQNIYTVAGGGTPVGMPATAWGGAQPLGTAIDSSGNIYIVWSGSHQVWVVNPGGVVSSVIGNRAGGFGGDGGPASAAMLSGPSGVALDASGNIYIADSGNGRIRKVTKATGVISTFASGLGFILAGIACDAAGNLFVASVDKLRIYKVTAAGLVTTAAGNGQFGSSGDGGPATSATFEQPQGVAVDANGNIYVADSRANTIRKFTVDGNISAVAAGGVTLKNPKSVAVDASGNIFVADVGNQVIRKFAAGGGAGTVAGNGSNGFSGDGGAAISASLGDPSGVTVDANGNLYIAEYGNYRIRKVTAATGVIATIAGNGSGGTGGDGAAPASAGLGGPEGVAIDSTGNYYIADFGDSVIRKVSPSTGAITTVAGTIGTLGYSGDNGPATSATLQGPTSVALDKQDNLYIADSFNNVIRKVTAATGIITTVVGTGKSGYTGDGGPATSATLSFPWGIAIGSALGNIFVTDQNNNVVRKVTASTGIITTVMGNGNAGYTGDGGLAVNATLNQPTGVAVDSSGIIYVADSGNNVIRQAPQSGNTTGNITTVAGNGKRGYSGDGAAATAAMLDYPRGIALDASDTNLYVADSNNKAIRRITRSVISTVAGNGKSGFSGDGGPATSAQMNTLYGVAAGSGGDILIADTLNQRIRAITGPATRLSVTAPASVTVGTPFQFTVAALDAGGLTAAGYTGTVHFTSSGSAVTLPGDFTFAGGTTTLSATVGTAGTLTITATDTLTAIKGISGTITAAPPVANGPVLTLLTPSNGTAGGPAFTLTVTGTGFNASALILWNGSPLASTTFGSATQLSGSVPAALIAAAGSASVSVVQPGATSNALTFTILPSVGGGGSSRSTVLPHIAVNGPYVTGFYVVNSGTAAAQFKIGFVNDNGQPLPLPVTGLGTVSQIVGALPALGSAYYEAGSASLPLTGGAAQVTADSAIAVQALFRLQVTDNAGNSTYFEAAVNPSAGSKDFEIPFDVTAFGPTGGQIYTGIAISNLDPANSNNVVCVAKNANGSVIPNAVNVPVLQPLGHWADFNFPALLGLRGTLECTSSAMMGALAIHALPSGGISSLPVILK